ncbi:MAG TPA: 3-deoxy-manno-octulosonate cytidylyltransferase [Longimicrobiaceae bacterium]|nr:3-deoxy-manno-octulosonate cytidylyltransferase [Longimicrobiaceae bacterium]
MRASVLGVIPARLASSRLPRKPLHTLAGRPLIEWVWRRVDAMGLFDRVVIATDSAEVADVARGFGAQVAITASTHPSGTDRVAEVAGMDEFRAFPVVVNVQGDEPFIRRDQVEAATALVRDGGWEIGTAATPLLALDAWREPSVVKVVLDDTGGAMLFSRAPVPFARDADPSPADLARGPFLRHLGIYAYRRDALLRWVALPEGVLERTERLEQLRPLAAGMRIGVARVEAGEGGVDTPADAARAEALLLAEMNDRPDHNAGAAPAPPARWMPA